MREIKFRGKDIHDDVWVYGYLYRDCYIIHKLHIEIEEDFVYGYVKSASEVNFRTVGQYTGIKDKNGKEIYEGDIIKFVPVFSIREKYNLSHEDIIGKVYWSVGAFRIIAGDLIIELADCLHKKVIGNIYENPELLKEVKNETA